MTSCDREATPDSDRCEEHRSRRNWIREAQDAYEALDQKEREAVDAATTRAVRACEQRRDLMYAHARQMEAKGDERERMISDQRSMEANTLAIDVAIACGGAHSFKNIEPVANFTFDVALQLMRAGATVTREAWTELALALDGDQLVLMAGASRFNRASLASEDILASDWRLSR